MLRIRRVFRLRKALNRSSNSPAQRLAKPLSKQSLRHAIHVTAPTLVALLFAVVGSSLAHAQGTIDFSGASTVMSTFKTFAIFAGAIICFGGLIFAGIRMMSGRFQDAIPGLFGALFGAGVLGWAAGWIGVASRPAGTGSLRLLQRGICCQRIEASAYLAACSRCWQLCRLPEADRPQ